MSNIDKRALAMTKELATLMVERFSMNPVSSKLLNEAWQKEFPDEVAIAKRMLSLLDELEAKDVQIANLTAERDALREGEMGDAKHSNTRAAADIYFQLVEECEIPPGGSLVEYVSELRERAAAAGKGEAS